MRCIGIRLSMYLLCLLRGFRQKVLGYVLFLRSYYLVFIQQSKKLKWSLYFSFLLLSFLCLGVNNVYAQTPEPTWEPIFQTPTPLPGNFYDCPDDAKQPAGWGQVTPDPNWSFHCQKCVTPQPSYLPTGTPVATAYPNKTIGYLSFKDTVIYNPVNPLQYYSYADPLNQWARLYYVHNFIGSPPPAGTEIRFGFDFNSTLGYNNWPSVPGVSNRVTLIMTCGNANCKMYNEAGSLVYNLGYNQSVEEILTPGTQGTWIKQVKYDVVITTSVYTGSPFIVRTSSIYPNNWTSTFYSFIQSPIGGTIFSDYSDGDNYCAEVGEVVDPINPIDFNIRVGPAQCMSIGGFTIPLGWLQSLVSWFTQVPYEFEFPGVQICLKPIQMGTLSVFGISVDMDQMLLVMAVVTLIRFVAR